MSDSGNQQKAPQFSILKLLMWTAVIAVVVMALTTGGSDTSIVYRFHTLPADDRALRQWYAEKIPRSKVEVKREDQELTVMVKHRFSTGFLTPPTPPWEEFGYSQPQMVSSSFHSQLFRLPPYLVVIGIVIFFGAWLMERSKKARAG